MSLTRKTCLAIAATLQLACSSAKDYAGGLPVNMHVRTQIKSASATTSVVAEFDIFRVDARCDTHYLGRVYLDKDIVRVGIPTGEPIYLDFIFASKGFLSPNVRAVRHGTLLTARANRRYDVEVGYVQGAYDVAIRETPLGGASSRPIERRPLSACRPRT